MAHSIRHNDHLLENLVRHMKIHANVLYLEAGVSIQRAYPLASREAAVGWRHENAPVF